MDAFIDVPFSSQESCTIRFLELILQRKKLIQARAAVCTFQSKQMVQQLFNCGLLLNLQFRLLFCVSFSKIRQKTVREVFSFVEFLLFSPLEYSEISFLKKYELEFFCLSSFFLCAIPKIIFFSFPKNQIVTFSEGIFFFNWRGNFLNF